MARILAITLNPALDLSIALERLAVGEVQRTQATQSTPAGKGNNVAQVLAALGHDVTVSGFLGIDNSGVFETAFAQWGVADAFVRVAGETRTNVKLSEADGRVTDINAAGAPVSADDWACLEQAVAAAVAKGLDAIVLAGSLPPGVTPAQCAELIEYGQAQGVAMWVDTSGQALTAAVAAGPTAIKPNDAELAELAELAGHDDGQSIDDCQQAAQALLSEGVGHVFVSRGAAGVLWCRPGRAWVARPPRIDVVNTVCAGDTLLAGLLHARLSGWDDQATLRFATALSADAVRRIGVGRADAADFSALCEQIDIQRLAPPIVAEAGAPH